MTTPERSCTKCGKPALFVAADELGLEWFECGDHGPFDNLAEVERVSLTPIDQWFRQMNVFQAAVSAKCPFCGADIAFGLTPEPFATHAYPTCKKFDGLDVLDFLSEVNRKLAQPRPNPSS